MKPLISLTPIIQTLAREAHVLPATGGAVEDLIRPDEDENTDRLFNGGMEEVNAYAEDPVPKIGELYRATPPTYRASDGQLFRFFIDGSIGTYFLGTVVEGERSFPIELAQIGSTVMERLPAGKIHRLAGKNRVLLLVPHRSGRGISDRLFEKLRALAEATAELEIADFDVGDPLSEHKQDPRDKAGAVARFKMHMLEKDVIKEAEEARGKVGDWIILDGAVKRGEFIAVQRLIGVAKSFDKNPQFYLQRGKNAVDRYDITRLLAGLPYAHRTVAFRAHAGKVAFWYVRLRPQAEVDYPLMGVVKVELPTPDGNPVAVELANQLSSALIGERNVTPYGRDKRWHCHLYPIFCAEQAIQSSFYSEAVLMAAIRWPAPSLTSPEVS